MTNAKKSQEKDQKPDGIKKLYVPKETGCRGGLEPTRYAYRTIIGKCADFKSLVDLLYKNCSIHISRDTT